MPTSSLQLLKAFKAEILTDLRYQLRHKGKDFTSEDWYTKANSFFYSTPVHIRRKAVQDLIAENKICRVDSGVVDLKPGFPVLVLLD